MDNTFELPVNYRGQDHMLPGVLHTYGYSYKIEVNVFGQVVIFEPDEEQNYRAVMKVEDDFSSQKIDEDLLQAIAEAFRSVFG